MDNGHLGLLISLFLYTSQLTCPELLCTLLSLTHSTMSTSLSPLQCTQAAPSIHAKHAPPYAYPTLLSTCPATLLPLSNNLPCKPPYLKERKLSLNPPSHASRRHTNLPHNMTTHPQASCRPSPLNYTSIHSLKLPRCMLFHFNLPCHTPIQYLTQFFVRHTHFDAPNRPPHTCAISCGLILIHTYQLTQHTLRRPLPTANLPGHTMHTHHKPHPTMLNCFAPTCSACAPSPHEIAPPTCIFQ